MGTCKTCGGTKTILSLRSWFLADGYRRERCGICTGTGQSSYRDNPDYVRFQREARERVAQWGSLKPRGEMTKQAA